MKRILILLTLFFVSNIRVGGQSISGKIVDPNGNGLSGLQLKLYISPKSYSTSSSTDGSFTFNNVTNIKNDNLPTGYAVSENYPNPFNPKTRIGITLPHSGSVSIDVYNMLGQSVMDQIVKNFAAGTSYVDIELRGLPNGFYIAHIILDGQFVANKKLMLVYGSQHLISSPSNSAFKMGKVSDNNAIPQSSKIDSLVVTGTTINKKVFTNLPVYTGTSLNLGNLVVELAKPGQPCTGIPTVVYSGKTYNTVQIGSQCWLKENLDIGTMIQGSQNQSNNGTIEKYCYDNISLNCDKYGGLYQWNEAMKYSSTEQSQGICPTGWHIPTNDEMQYLKTTTGSSSNSLKANGQGSGSGAGNNSSGFTSILAGERYNDGTFRNLSTDAYYFSSTQYSSSNVYYMDLFYTNNVVTLNQISNNKIYGFSIRCIRDEQTSLKPQVPILDSPIKGIRNVLTSATLKWNSVSGSISYTVQLSKDSLFSSFILNQSGTSGTSVTVSSLTNSTTYYWRVSAANSYGNSDWSAVYNFTVADAIKNLGASGGRVEVTNNSSTINGTFIEIPSGAINSNINLVISEASYKPENDENAIVVKFEPDGLQFNKPVKIGIPFNPVISDPTRLRAFYYNKDSLTVTEMPVDSIDYDKQVIVTHTTHFSDFYSGDHSVWADINLLNIGGKFGAKVAVYGLATDGATNLGLFGIPLGADFILSSKFKFLSAGQACEDYINVNGYKLFSTFGVSLYQENVGLDTKVASSNLFIRQDERAVISNGKKQKMSVWKTVSSGNYFEEIDSKWITDKDIRQQLYSGEPLVFRFDNFTPEAGKKYYVKVQWALAVHPEAFYISRLTPIYEFQSSNDSRTLSQAMDYNDDQNNNFIDDSFEPNIVPVPPYSVVIQNPMNNSTNVSANLTLQWSATDPQESILNYDVFLGTTSTSLSKVASNTSSTSFQPTGLTNGTIYYWKIIAINEYGLETSSDIVKFTTSSSVTIPSIPTLSTPADVSTNQSTSPSLVWNTSSAASSYALQVSTSTSFNSYFYNQSALSSNSKQLSGLASNTKYYWRVNATNTSGTSGWSSVWSFTTGSSSTTNCPSTITYSGKTYNTVLIGTQCWLKENLNVGTKIDDKLDQMDNSIIEKYCYDNLESNCTKYGGLYQLYEAMHYSTIAQAQGICPTGWHIPTINEFERLGYSVNYNSNSLKATGQGNGTGSGTNSSGFSALLAGIHYNYNFGTFDGQGVITQFWNSSDTDLAIIVLTISGSNPDWDDHKLLIPEDALSIRCLKDGDVVSIPTAPTNSTPSDGSTGLSTSPTLSWNASSGATSYTLQVSTSSSFTSFVYNRSGLTGTNQQVTGLASSTKYYWRVSSTNSSGTSALSSVWSFTTLSKPDVPILSAPLNGAANLSINPILAWGASSNAESYTLQVSVSSSFSSYVYNQGGLTNTSQLITDLDYSTIYYWKVSATNSAGTSSFSMKYSFTTANPTLDGKPCIQTPTLIYSNKTYNTVQIGKQCWLKENLDIGTMIKGNGTQIDNGIIEKYCYGDNPDNCSKYGGLYQWAEAIQYQNGAANNTTANPSLSGNIKGICPIGWHIPTTGEFRKLYSYVDSDGNTLKRSDQGTSGGAGTNSSGFSALMAGYLSGKEGWFSLNSQCNMWSRVEYNDNYSWAYYFNLMSDDATIAYLEYIFKSAALSIRCLKD